MGSPTRPAHAIVRRARRGARDPAHASSDLLFAARLADCGVWLPRNVLAPVPPASPGSGGETLAFTTSLDRDNPLVGWNGCGVPAALPSGLRSRRCSPSSRNSTRTALSRCRLAAASKLRARIAPACAIASGRTHIMLLQSIPFLPIGCQVSGRLLRERPVLRAANPRGRAGWTIPCTDGFCLRTVDRVAMLTFSAIERRARRHRPQCIVRWSGEGRAAAIRVSQRGAVLCDQKSSNLAYPFRPPLRL
jgi:hypothetical protein